MSLYSTGDPSGAPIGGAIALDALLVTDECLSSRAPWAVDARGLTARVHLGFSRADGMVPPLCERNLNAAWRASAPIFNEPPRVPMRNGK